MAFKPQTITYQIRRTTLWISSEPHDINGSISEAFTESRIQDLQVTERSLYHRNKQRYFINYLWIK